MPAASQSFNSAILHSTDKIKRCLFLQEQTKPAIFPVPCWKMLIWWNWNVLPKLISLIKTCLQVFSVSHISCLFLRFRMLSRKGSSHQNRGLNLLHSYPRRCSAHHTWICPQRSSFSGFIHENIQNTSVISMWIKTKSKNRKCILVFGSSNERAVIHTILL